MEDRYFTPQATDELSLGGRADGSRSGDELLVGKIAQVRIYPSNSDLTFFKSVLSTENPIVLECSFIIDT